MGLGARVAVEADEDLPAVPDGDPGPLAKRDEGVAAACEHGAHLQSVLQEFLQPSGDLEDDVLLPGASPSDGTRISASVPRVDHNHVDGPGLGVGFGLPE